MITNRAHHLFETFEATIVIELGELNSLGHRSITRKMNNSTVVL